MDIENGEKKYHRDTFGEKHSMLDVIFIVDNGMLIKFKPKTFSTFPFTQYFFYFFF